MLRGIPTGGTGRSGESPQGGFLLSGGLETVVKRKILKPAETPLFTPSQQIWPSNTLFIWP